jgi:uncharacterized protein YtpQ (UPF0354 family)
MKWWPFGKSNGRVTKAEDEVGRAAVLNDEPAALERLLSRNCSRDEFLLLFVKALQEAMPDSVMTMAGDASVHVINSEGKESTTFLENAWIAYAKDPENRHGLLERHLSVAKSLGDDREPIARERIVAIVKDAQYVAHFEPEHEPPAEHLCGDLWVVYAEDFPDRTPSLKRSRVREAGIDESELSELAKHNLRRLMPPAERHGDGPWYLLTAGGDYTASLLLFDGLWEELANLVDGRVVAVAPARDTLLFTGSDSEEGLTAIRKHASDIITSGNYLISATMLVRVDGRWDVFNLN